MYYVGYDSFVLTNIAYGVVSWNPPETIFSKFWG